MKMKKKVFLKLSAVLIGALMCLGFSKVQAAESIFSDINITRNSLNLIAKANSLSSSNAYLGISSERESGASYAWNMKTDGTPGAVAWKITKRSSSTDQSKNYDDLYYCLNAEQGFGIANGEMAEGKIDYYDYSTEMNVNSKELIASKVNNKTELSENYNKILWILDNSYMPTREDSYKSSLEYKNLMNKIGVEIENDDKDLNEEQIELVQQMAIWYYTNSSNTQKYHLASGSLPSLYLKKAGSNRYNQITSIYYGTDEFGTQITGRVLQNKMDKLFKYLINNADASYSKNKPTLSLSNVGATVEESGNYYIAGPFKLTGENVGQIKEITASINKNFTLLDSSKKVVDNNEFSKVIGNNGFYLRFNKSDIKSTKKITLNLNYKYDTRTSTFMTSQSSANNTQPVAVIKTEEKNENTSTDITINLIEVSVEKVWDDNNNQDGKRPTSIRVQLYENGVAKGDSVTLNENKLTHTWTGLLAGKTYTVKELDANGNIIENNGKYNNDYSTSYRVIGNTTTITNKHIPEVISKKVVKVWDDQNNQDGVRPNKVIVTLYKTINNVKEKVETVELSEPSWSYEWNNLTKYQDGKEIKYTVEEVIPDGYTVKYSEDTFTITNKYTPGTVSKTVIKEWIDNNNQDGIRADEVTVQLYANGVAKGNSVKLNKSNSWTYTWAGLPEKENGKTIFYEVKELKIGNTNVANNSAAGYTVDYSVNENNTTITNTHIPEKIFDLALRKFITNINEESYNREPVVDTSTIATTGTATYKHTKTPLSVQVGDIVTYTIRVYNEGEKDGYVSEITDYLPEWLDFLPEDSLNQEYL